MQPPQYPLGGADSSADERPSRTGSPRPWWAPALEPDLPRIGARRAYTEVLLVFAGFFLVGIIAAGLLLAGRSQDVAGSSGSWGVYLTQAVEVLTQAGLAVTVVILLAARRGVTAETLGLRIPRLSDGRFAASRTVRIVAWCLFALIAGGVVNGLLQSGHLPNNSTNAPGLIFGVADSLQAGLVEELVVLAFVIVTLRQAGRPLWEVILIALLLRGSYHIYYGPGVVGILLWAAIYVWLYLRFRQLLPMMICHAAWDAVAFLAQRWDVVAGVATLVVVAIWIAAPILWLTERNATDYQPTALTGPWQASPGSAPAFGAPGWPPVVARPIAPAGWYPDPDPDPGPGAQRRWRWWDGRTWTHHVSPLGAADRGRSTR